MVRFTLASSLAATCLVATLCCLGAGQSHAETVVLDFESLISETNTLPSHGTVYGEDGFTLNSSGTGQFRSVGTLTSQFSGSTSLFTAIGTETTLTRDGGGAFALNAVDLAELSGSLAVDMTFTGMLTGGGTTTQTFSLDAIAFAPETFNFDSTFDDIISVSWISESPGYQFDNIVLETSSVVPIPAAAPMALLGMGLVGLVRRARRRKKAA